MERHSGAHARIGAQNPAPVSDRLKGEAHAHALVHLSRPWWLDPQCATGARRLGLRLDALGGRGPVRDCPPGHRIGPGVPGLGRARHSPGDTGRRAAAHAPPRPRPLRRGAHMGGHPARRARSRPRRSRSSWSSQAMRKVRTVRGVSSTHPPPSTLSRHCRARRRGGRRSLICGVALVRRFTNWNSSTGATPSLSSLRTGTAVSMTSPNGFERLPTTWTSDPCARWMRRSSAG